MKKRLLAIALCVALLAGCTPALAGVDTLDRALSRWMDAQTAVRFSATAQLQTWLPFTDETLSMFNGVLKHLNVEGSVAYHGDNSDSELRIALDGAQMMTLAETLTDGVSTLQTSLLPNRTLTTRNGSAVDALLADSEAEPESAVTTDALPEPTPSAQALTEAGTAEQTAQVAPSAAATDAAETPAPNAAPTPEPAEQEQPAADVFSMLDAVEQLQTCYQALTDGIQPFATEKRANYNIKGFGAGKWSRIARLTAEQSEGLVTELRAVLACGLNEACRERIAHLTFQKGFIVALYQNADQQDLCVYLKGNVTDADGVQRKLVWQWAFTSNGLKRKDMMTFTLARLSGAADSLAVDATWTQESRSDLFALSGKTETTLRKGKATDKDVVRASLDGTRAEDNTLTCKGELSRETTGGSGEDTVKTNESAEINLLFTPTDTQSVLSGTVVCQKLRNKIPQMAFTVTLAENAAALPTVNDAANADASTENAGEPTVTVSGSDGQEPTVVITGNSDNPGTVDAQEEPVTSLEQVTNELEDETAATAGAETGNEYLVGTLPIGVSLFTVPKTAVTLDLDTLPLDQLQTLLQEAAQNLAAKLLPAIAALPAEDAALLRDGMTDQDYEAFLALLGNQ